LKDEKRNFKGGKRKNSSTNWGYVVEGFRDERGYRRNNPRKHGRKGIRKSHGGGGTLSPVVRLEKKGCRRRTREGTAEKSGLPDS